MQKIIVTYIFLLVTLNFLYAQNDEYIYWKHYISYPDSCLISSVKIKNSSFVAFPKNVGIILRKSFLDSFINYCSPNFKWDPFQPDSFWCRVNSLDLIYRGSKLFLFGKDSIRVTLFDLGKTSEWMEHNHYYFYYSELLGVLYLHNDEYGNLPEIDCLANLYNKRKKPVYPEKQISKLIEDIGWPLEWVK